MGVLEHVGPIARRVIDRMPLARHLAELKTGRSARAAVNRASSEPE